MTTFAVMQGNHEQVTYDQMGCEVNVPRNPRIISLVPSQTELLFDLGLSDQIVGITKFCIHPQPDVKYKPIIGGTKKFRFSTIDDLCPDLIIGNKEENYQEGIEALKKRYPVWMSDIVTIADALNMIRSLGVITGKTEKAISISNQIKGGLDTLKQQPSRRTLYFIWQQPFMVAGRNTFIDEMLKKIGLANVITNETRYPEITTERLINLKPELILLSSEPYPFKEKHVAEFKAICPNAEIRLVDGEMFSWYGSRILKAIEYFNSLSF